MKRALALIFLSCVLCAQGKPAAEAPNPDAAKKPAETKVKIPPINVRDELIELIHQLKEDARRKIEDPLRFASPNYMQAAAAEYEAGMKAKTEAQRLLLQALIDLSKLPVDSPLHIHSSSAARLSPRR